MGRPKQTELPAWKLRNCAVCGAGYTIKKNVSKAAAETRLYCSRKCAARGNWDKYKEAGSPWRAPGTAVETPEGIKYVRPGRAKNALQRYLESPRLCKGCGGPLIPREGEVPSDMKERGYCTKACSDNHRRTFWSGEGNTDFYNVETLQDRVKVSTLPFLTKREGKSLICRHSTKVFRSAFPDLKTCQFCGRETRLLVEVAHVRAVASFTPEDTLCTINQLDNLIGLDHICHKEFDAGLISIEEIKEKVATRKPRLCP